MRVKRLAQEHNTVSPARARTWNTRFGNKHTNREATEPPREVTYTRTQHYEKLSGFSHMQYLENEAHFSTKATGHCLTYLNKTACEIWSIFNISSRLIEIPKGPFPAEPFK